MKVGVVVDNDLNNDKRVLREIAILKDAGHEIFILCFGFNDKAYTPVEGIKITRIWIHRKLKNSLFFFLNLIPVYEFLWSAAVKKFIKANNPDVLHVHDLYMSKAGRSGIRKTGLSIPMILDLHENYPYAVTTYNWTKGVLRGLISQPQKWQKKEREYLSFADRIIVLSDEFRDLLTERYPEFSKEKFLSLPNVPDLSQNDVQKQVALKVNIKRNATVIFYYGVVAERRGIFDALQAFSELAKEDHPMVFLIIGPVDKKDKKGFFNLIFSESLKELVYYVSWIDNSELPAYLEISDICIAPFHKNPQHESGVANKIYDYMLGKKPVIASDCRPQKNLIQKYNCGLVYSTRDELKAAIKKLSDDPELRAEMGNRGYNAILNDHNAGVIKDKLLAMYSQLLHKKT